MKYAVGIDVGGTNTRVALINEKYDIKERVQFGQEIPIPSIFSPNPFITSLIWFNVFIGFFDLIQTELFL